MKGVFMKFKLTALLTTAAILFSGCAGAYTGAAPEGGLPSQERNTLPLTQGGGAELGDDSVSFGEAIEDTGAYDGYFEGDGDGVTVEWVSGTENAYKLEGNTLYFTAITEESVYSLSGSFRGSVVIDVGDEYKFELELKGLSLICDRVNPITVKSADEVTIKAKKDTKSYIYDLREAIDSADEALYSGAIHSETDLELGGKGELTVVSENNNGIHSKNDLQVKNLSLFVACIDNCLKGKDSVEIEGGSTTLIASGGDCIKTSDSDISEKGNQRGDITVTGGTHTLYAACDGMDAAHNVIVDGSTTVLGIYTDKYSSYSGEVTSVSEDGYYIRFPSQDYSYSVKFINSDTQESLWVDAQYHSKAQGQRSSYYYYFFPKPEGYDKLRFFVYSDGMELSQELCYAAASDEMVLSTAYDTIALTSSGYSWTSYTTRVQEGGFGGPGGRPGGGGPGGMGGMQDGNSDKGDYSTKGIKAANEIVIENGTVNIKAYDDAIHANSDQSLENGASPLGNVTVNGGNITVYSNDDGLHADGELVMTDGTVTVTQAYEGIEGRRVNITGGCLSVYAKDDGVNATATSDTAVSIGGGRIYISCGGDGIDSNSRASYSGIVFSGGETVVISTSGGNSAIDSEQGYLYSGGYVIALMPVGGMANEATHCQGFESIGCVTKASLLEGEYLVATVKDKVATVKIAESMSAYIIALGDSDAEISTEASTELELDKNGVAWN